MPVRRNVLDERIEIRIQSQLLPALEAAAEAHLTTASEYMRRAVIDRLRADGIALTPQKTAA